MRKPAITHCITPLSISHRRIQHKGVRVPSGRHAQKQVRVCGGSRVYCKWALNGTRNGERCQIVFHSRVQLQSFLESTQRKKGDGSFIVKGEAHAVHPTRRRFLQWLKGTKPKKERTDARPKAAERPECYDVHAVCSRLHTSLLKLASKKYRRFGSAVCFDVRLGPESGVFLCEQPFEYRAWESAPTRAHESILSPTEKDALTSMADNLQVDLEHVPELDRLVTQDIAPFFQDASVVRAVSVVQK